METSQFSLRNLMRALVSDRSKQEKGRDEEKVQEIIELEPDILEGIGVGAGAGECNLQ